ncbi:MAG: hypothetical protein M3495_16555 [Pseudomonadota bacterium]|nr:hypothetical protein [Gammaproteobacteria bacterium]MDQ3583104.1 hypothetical protein [Pseudomonadota bacterium]
MCPASAPAIAFRPDGWNTATSSRDLAPNDVYGYAKTGTIRRGQRRWRLHHRNTDVIRTTPTGWCLVPEANEGDSTAGNPIKVTR